MKNEVWKRQENKAFTRLLSPELRVSRCKFKFRQQYALFTSSGSVIEKLPQSKRGVKALWRFFFLFFPNGMLWSIKQGLRGLSASVWSPEKPKKVRALRIGQAWPIPWLKRVGFRLLWASARPRHAFLNTDNPNSNFHEPKNLTHIFTNPKT